MRVLVTGAKGMLGSVLRPRLEHGNQIVGVDDVRMAYDDPDVNYDWVTRPK